MICQGLWVKIGELGIYTYSSTSKNIINAECFYKRHRGIPSLSNWEFADIDGKTRWVDYNYVFVSGTTNYFSYWGGAMGQIFTVEEVCLAALNGGLRIYYDESKSNGAANVYISAQTTINPTASPFSFIRTAGVYWVSISQKCCRRK